MKKDGPSKGMMAHIKSIALTILVLQNVTLVLVMRYTRTSSPPDGRVYLASSAVFMAEAMKLVMSLAVLFSECGWSVRQTSAILYSQIWMRPRESGKVLVPALLYTIQNNLLYLAVSNLEAATFQVTYQLKILTTAVFSVTMLNRHLSWRKWLSLVLLMCGVALVQISTVAAGTSPERSMESQALGFACVVGSTLTSGFSGVYFEKLMKEQASSLWVRNVTMALFSMVLSFAGIMYNDVETVREYGLLQGYTSFVWLVVFNSAFGGLVVAIVVKYADNIVKGFAMSISIILSSIVSGLLFDFEPTFLWVVGAVVVLAATGLYQAPDAPNYVAPNTAGK